VPTKRVLAIGGAEDRENESIILKKFVQLAGGEDAQVLLITVATHEAEQTIKDYRKVFRRLHAGRMKAFDVSLREDTTSKRGMQLIENATGIFFSGGDQLDISALLGGTRMLDLICERYAQGAFSRARVREQR